MTEHKKIMINESFFNTASNGGNKTKKIGEWTSKKRKTKTSVKTEFTEKKHYLKK